MPIRSIPMGLVEIHGKAFPAADGKLINSPVTQTPCLVYKVDIERYTENSKGTGSWRHWKTDADGVPFYLEDGTGKALVNAQGAEYDLIQTARRVASFAMGDRMLWGEGDASLWTGPGASDFALITYAQSLVTGRGSSRWGSVGQSAPVRETSPGRYRFTEYCILADHWYDVTGTCVENPHPRDEHDRNMVLKGQNEPTFLIAWRNKQQRNKSCGSARPSSSLVARPFRSSAWRLSCRSWVGSETMTGPCCNDFRSNEGTSFLAGLSKIVIRSVPSGESRTPSPETEAPIPDTWRPAPAFLGFHGFVPRPDPLESIR